jgi:hypothetical protein
MGGSYPAALVTGTATLLRLCLLAPLLPEKCELLHIGTLFSSSLCTGRCTEVGDDGSPERQRRAAVGSGASASGPCSPQDPWVERLSSTKCRVSPAVIKLQSNRTMVVFRGIIERSRNATWSSYHPGIPLLGV